MNKLYYTASEVAGFLNVETTTIRFWIKELGLKVKRKGNNALLLTKEDKELFRKIATQRAKGRSLTVIKAELKQGIFNSTERVRQDKIIGYLDESLSLIDAIKKEIATVNVSQDVFGNKVK